MILWSSRGEACSLAQEGSRLRWTGPGRTAFLGALGLGGEASVAQPALRVLAAGASSRALSRYFARGGRAAWVLDDPGLESGEGGSRRLGEDGGPGYRTGLYALADLEEVGTIAVLGRRGEAAVREILELASRRDDLLFLFEMTEEAARSLGIEEALAEGRAPCAASLRILRRNAASLVWRAGEAESEASDPGRPDLGEVAAFLEASDFEAEPPFAPRKFEPPPWLSPEDALYLCAFRRLQGLRRSLELGTRWAVFELNGPLLWKALEREAAAFLRSLADAGLLEPPMRGDPFSVECVPVASTDRPDAPAGRSDSGEDAPASRPRETGISIRVRARLAEPYASALARGFSLGPCLPRTEDRTAEESGT